MEIPPSVTVYTRKGCEFCFNAKNFLKEKGLPFEEHVLGVDYSVKTLVALSGGTTVPQIFINGKRLHGFDELKKHFN